MHSSRMRTGRALTVFRSLLFPAGGGGGGGGCSRGVSVLGGAWSRGGVWSGGGGSGPRGGVVSWSGTPPVNRMTK